MSTTNTNDSTQETWTAAIQYIVGRKSAEEALGFLSHISTLLANTDEPARLGRSVAASCVPFLGSAVSIDITGVGAGQILAPGQRFASALREVRAAALRDGRSPFVISDHPNLTEAVRPDELENLDTSTVGSADVVRLVFRGHDSGVLAVVRTVAHPKGAIGPADVALIAELANRLALVNAFADLTARTSSTTG